VLAGSVDGEGDSLGPTQERFGFTLFMSSCVHVVLILGVGFTVQMAPQIMTNMEITLASYQSIEVPEDADFLAQANQQGSGTEDEALAPATPFNSDFYANKINDLDKFLVERPIAPNQTGGIVGRDGGAQQRDRSEPVPEQQTNEIDSRQLGDAVATLRAQLDLQRQEFAKRPRRYTITSASTKADQDAAYLDNWRKRIEGVGNLNYPTEASNQGIYGTLRLLVAINPDGTVSDIRILRSSGARALDEAAIRIVQLSAPFQPFPPAIRSQVDVLEIIRTWQFQRGNKFSSF